MSAKWSLVTQGPAQNSWIMFIKSNKKDDVDQSNINYGMENEFWMKCTDKSFILTNTLSMFLIPVIETMCCAANNNYEKLLTILPS